MMESIRRFALDSLVAAGERDAVVRRHAAYFAELAETARPFLEAEGQQVWLDRLVGEHDNLRAALRLSVDSGEPELGLRIAGSVWRFYHRRGHLSEGREWLELLLGLDGASPEARAAGIEGLAGIAYWQADYEEAKRLYLDLLALYRELGLDVRVADTLFALSTTTAWLGDLEGGLALAEEARAVYEKAGAPNGAARVSGAIAWNTWQAGHLEDALELWTDARTNYAALGDEGEVRQTDLATSAVLHQLGRSEEAVAVGGETLEAMVHSDDVSGVIMAVDFLAAVTAARSPGPAVRLAAAADRLRSELGGGLSADSVGLEPVRSVVAASMDAADIDAAWAEGRQMTLEEAVALGREVATAGVGSDAG
jgi:tetratricopeptide (TPR) repeat protein